MALTGYDVVVPDSYDDELKAKFGDKYMQHVLAQTIRGDKPSKVITDIQKLAESYGMYVLIGLPEKDEVRLLHQHNQMVFQKYHHFL